METELPKPSLGQWTACLHLGPGHASPSQRLGRRTHRSGAKASFGLTNFNQLAGVDSLKLINLGQPTWVNQLGLRGDSPQHQPSPNWEDRTQVNDRTRSPWIEDLCSWSPPLPLAASRLLQCRRTDPMEWIELSPSVKTLSRCRNRILPSAIATHPLGSSPWRRR